MNKWGRDVASSNPPCSNQGSHAFVKEDLTWLQRRTHDPYLIILYSMLLLSLLLLFNGKNVLKSTISNIKLFKRSLGKDPNPLEAYFPPQIS